MLAEADTLRIKLFEDLIDRLESVVFDRSERAESLYKEITAGLEEPVDSKLEKLAKAIPEKQILVINAWVVEQKDWLEELMRRIPAHLKNKVLLFGKSFEVQQLADYYGIPIVPSDEVEDLAFELIRRPEAGNLQVSYLGDSITTEALRRLLPRSIEVSSIDPDAGLRELFLALGVPEAVLDAVRADELEKALARERAA